MKRKGISQIKPRFGQGRAGLRHKIKTTILNNKPIVQMTVNLPNVLAPQSPKAQDKVIPIPSNATPQMKHWGDASSRKTYRMLAGKFPFILIQFIDPPYKPVKILIPEIPGSFIGY